MTTALSSLVAFALRHVAKMLEARGRFLRSTGVGSDSICLERYYVLFRERTQRFGVTHRRKPFNIYLHHFCGDDGHDEHDHPWSFVSIVLAGGYWEHSGEVKRWRGAGSIVHFPAVHRHRITLDCAGKDCWTIVLRGPNVREWGYWIDGRWRLWRDYLEPADTASHSSHHRGIAGLPQSR